MSERSPTPDRLAASEEGTTKTPTALPTTTIAVPPGGAITVIVDVGVMVVPYTIAYAGTTVIKAMGDRAAPVPLIAGEQILGWAFSHHCKGWHHTVGVSVNGGAPIVLESRSEKNNDQDHSVNCAIVKA